ncbi:MAG TPA: hypothetical protein VD862_03705 [Candidatus Paceibacterota bacterium]|nr:hypothetical protein [Candidatus Paceibacterota bacterium]
MKKSRLAALVGLIVAVLAVLFVIRVETTTYAQDTVLDGDQVIPARHRWVLAGGASLTVNGNLEIQGELACGEGGMTVSVNGDLVLGGKVSCASGGDVAIAFAGSLDAEKGSVIDADGSVVISDDAQRLASDLNRLDSIYDDVERETGAGPRLGPLADDASAIGSSWADEVVAARSGNVIRHASWLGATAYAQGESHVTLRGKFVIRTPKPGKKQIVLIDTPGVDNMNLTDLNLTGPDGREGASDMDTNCNAVGKNGEDAFRLMARAPNLRINNVTLNLGNGGKGGDASTNKDCDPGTAVGGKGGKAGNFKLFGTQSFTIEGDFTINPGKGGEGGFALALGRDGGPSEKGGDATATGGAGAENRKRLSQQGTVNGVANVQVGSVVGGKGGDADALPGTGGAGVGCGNKGGDGGKGTATAGKGGDARAIIGGGAVRTPGAQDTGGEGGISSADGGKAGDGGACDASGPGGNGGTGGAAVSKPGKGGSATVSGADGAKKNETGGNGGNGGAGCLPGKLGKGGTGNPPGEDGKDGKNLCVSETKTPTPSPTEEADEPTPPPATASANLSYDHVAPGEYSEVYATVKGAPGAKVTAKLAGPGVSGNAEQTATAGDNGEAKFTWKIVSYGDYSLSGTAGGAAFTAKVSVK